jgi:hypothetical protein
LAIILARGCYLLIANIENDLGLRIDLLRPANLILAITMSWHSMETVALKQPGNDNPPDQV